MKKISIITGAYNEESSVESVYQAVNKTLQPLSGIYEYEHIFLDNCSTDGTLSILRRLAAADKRVKVLSYSKNFGPIKTELVGYCYASGDAAILYDANLKDPCELIPVFIKKWEEGFDVVYGVREKTKDSFLMLFMRKSFYKICNWLSEDPLPENAGGFRLMDRKVINELKKIDDYKPYLRGLISTLGFRQLGIPYERRARSKGRSKSNLGYLFDFAINAIISHSILPIRACTYVGGILAVTSFITAFVYGILKLMYWNIQAPGIATLIILVLFFSGIQLFFLGVIGEYVGAIHAQVRKKPFVIVRDKINFDDTVPGENCALKI